LDINKYEILEEELFREDIKMAKKYGILIIYAVILCLMTMPLVNTAYALSIGDLTPDLTPTGTFIVNNSKMGTGYGELTINNGLDSDAIVVLSKSYKPKVAWISVYVQSNDSYTIIGIPDGVYILYFSFGENWDNNSKKFTKAAIFQRFEKELEFKTTETPTEIWYDIYSVTLHPVPEGTAKTRYINETDFPEVGSSNNP
jgi:hypothetical protein